MPRTEFLHVDDLANASYFLLQNYNEQGLVNIGCGTDVSIKELAELIVAEVVYEEQLIFDTTKPDALPRNIKVTRKTICWVGMLKPTFSMELKKLFLSI